MVDLTVVCNGCSRQIRIPSTMPSEKVLRQMSLSPLGVPRNVLCPYCKLASLYLAPQFRPLEFENTDPNLPPGDRVSVCIEVRCAEESCASRVQLNSVMIESDEMRKEASEMLSESVCTNAVCGQGHAHNWRHLVADCKVYAISG
jgi:hypothetical protein